MRKSLVAVLAVMLVGCSGPVIDDPVEEATPDPEPTEVITVGPVDTRSPAPDADVVESHEGPIVRASAETIAPDPEIMATMECEPVSEAVISYGGRFFGAPPTEPVQVLIGEGLTEDELWWIIAIYGDRLTPSGQSAVWLTNQPGLPDDERGQWIGVGATMRAPDGVMRPSWDNIHWDHDRLLLGQSAMARALSCLAEV